MDSQDAQDSFHTRRLAHLGTLLAGFAHEVRNPLSTIGLNLQLVLEEYADAESTRDKRTVRRLGLVEAEVHRLQSILEEFLRFARAPEIKREPAELGGMLRALVDFHAPEAEARSMGLRFFGDPAVGLVALDEGLLRAAVLNLVRNALDVSKPGDQVLVSVQRVVDEVVIRVVDTGEGMDEATLRQAFHPYFSTKERGTGLGLPTTQRIVEEHGGRLECSSEPGKGTQFSVWLPAPLQISYREAVSAETDQDPVDQNNADDVEETQ